MKAFIERERERCKKNEIVRCKRKQTAHNKTYFQCSVHIEQVFSLSSCIRFSLHPSPAVNLVLHATTTRRIQESSAKRVFQRRHIDARVGNQ